MPVASAHKPNAAAKKMFFRAFMILITASFDASRLYAECSTRFAILRPLSNASLSRRGGSLLSWGERRQAEAPPVDLGRRWKRN